ncbi:hypothetical protein PRI8871_03197 [Pseudoprimorskyibacter insulae]|uniref:Uncharacterized protein n=1 Tax=Pseudoprimorskyibacter insulae TaxID=1695997 RepID=A0A2R8AZT9_9RHOB|nr:hypothetical protein PRI8871_03197 [Pseudoprimorskyibacter insulae]
METISGFYLGHSRKSRMFCLRGHGRNRPTLLSSKTGQRQKAFTLRDWQEWLDALELWMTGCCAARKAGDSASLLSRQRTSAGSQGIG